MCNDNVTRVPFGFPMCPYCGVLSFQDHIGSIRCSETGFLLADCVYEMVFREFDPEFTFEDYSSDGPEYFVMADGPRRDAMAERLREFDCRSVGVFTFQPVAGDA